MMSRRSRGFTLIELLVALFVTAILFAIGYGALMQGLHSRTEIEQQSQRLLAVQRTVRTLEQDFETLQPRPVRNLLGDGYQAAILTPPNAAAGVGLDDPAASGGIASAALPPQGSAGASGSAVPLVTFTRGSWTNPAGIQRSELQRVSYLLENGQLIREYLPVLDATLSDAPIRRVLLKHVERFTLRFMDAAHQWQSQWPPPQLGNNPALQLRARPVAVQVTLQLKDWGVITRIIEVAG